MSRRPSRRRTLRAIGALAGGGLAGCVASPRQVDDSPSGSGSDGEPGNPTSTPDDVDVGIHNRGEEPRRVTVTISDGAETRFERSYGVNGGVGRLASGAGDAISVPGTYTVTARLETGAEARYQWHLEGALGDLTVEVLPTGEIEFVQEVRCTPACQPVSEEGSATALPYAAPGAEETFTTGNVGIETESGETVSLRLQIGHDGTDVLDYTYEVTPDRQIRIDGVTATAGAYDVVATTASGEREEYTWEIPPEHGWPQLSVLVGADEQLSLGCGFLEEVGVTVRNDADESRTLTLRLHRDGSIVDETTAAVAPGTETQVGLSIPIGGRYRLTAETESGDRAESSVVACSCYGDRSEVVVDAEGVQTDTTLAVCA